MGNTNRGVQHYKALPSQAHQTIQPDLYFTGKRDFWEYVWVGTLPVKKKKYIFSCKPTITNSAHIITIGTKNMQNGQKLW